jgi:hypothetical protein
MHQRIRSREIRLYLQAVHSDADVNQDLMEGNAIIRNGLPRNVKDVVDPENCTTTENYW